MIAIPKLSPLSLFLSTYVWWCQSTEKSQTIAPIWSDNSGPPSQTLVIPIPKLSPLSLSTHSFSIRSLQNWAWGWVIPKLVMCTLVFYIWTGTEKCLSQKPVITLTRNLSDDIVTELQKYLRISIVKLGNSYSQADPSLVYPHHQHCWWPLGKGGALTGITNGSLVLSHLDGQGDVSWALLAINLVLEDLFLIYLDLPCKGGPLRLY